MAKERSKAIFSFHILFDKRILVSIIVLLKPKLHVQGLLGKWKMWGKMQL